jgi:hypothetical protein
VGTRGVAGTHTSKVVPSTPNRYQYGNVPKLRSKAMWLPHAQNRRRLLFSPVVANIPGCKSLCPAGRPFSLGLWSFGPCFRAYRSQSATVRKGSSSVALKPAPSALFDRMWHLPWAENRCAQRDVPSPWACGVLHLSHGPIAHNRRPSGRGAIDSTPHWRVS